MSSDAAMPRDGAMTGEAPLPMSKAVAPSAVMVVIPVTPAMTPVPPAADPAIGVSVVVVAGGVPGWLRASGEAKSDGDHQHQHSRRNSAARHCLGLPHIRS